MRYYAARQRESDGCWDWTCLHDGNTSRAGACAVDPRCQHPTKEEAEEHEAQRIREKLKGGRRLELDTKFGHKCSAEGCLEKAFHALDAGGWDCYEVCPRHLEDLSWFKVTERWQS